MPETHSSWVLAAGALLVAMGLVGSYFALPHLFRNMVTEKVVLKVGSEALERFTKTPLPLHYHVYIFNVENPEEVSSKGARPVLTEKGPYVYDMYKERVDLRFQDEDDTVSYSDKKTFFFNEKKSGCRSENDVVTVIHAPILGTALKLQLVSSMGLNIFNDAVPLLFKDKNIFLTTTVRELLFGGVFVNCSYPEDSFPAGAICQGLRQRAPRTYRRDGTDFYFSMFNHLNGTPSERVRVSRGQVEPESVGRIRDIGGNATLSTWRQGTPCNLINGTDGTIFKPFLTGTTSLPIYTAASCRSLNLAYQGDTELQGVPAMRFAIDETMLASGKDYPANRCFCVAPPEPDQGSDVQEEEEVASRRRRREAEASLEEKELQSCLPRGAMDMSKCSGSPVILTFPHFYLGAKEFLEYPISLSPNKSDHETIVDIEPVTGIPLRAKKRVQLNMFLKKIEDFNYLSSVSEGLFPILWVEEGITLEGPSMDKISSANKALTVIHALPWGAVGLGVFLILGATAYLTGLAQAVTSALRPKPSKVQQVEDLALSAPDLPPYRMAVGFGPNDSSFALKAHMASTGYRGNLADDYRIPQLRSMYSATDNANLNQRPGKIMY